MPFASVAARCAADLASFCTYHIYFIVFKVIHAVILSDSDGTIEV